MLGLSNQNMQSNKLESYDLASQYMIAAIFQVGLLALEQLLHYSC